MVENKGGKAKGGRKARVSPDVLIIAPEGRGKNLGISAYIVIFLVWRGGWGVWGVLDAE